MNSKRIIYTLITLMLTGAMQSLTTVLQAQEQSEVSIKITTTINGKKETFEKSYNSQEEMKADEELQEFKERAGMEETQEVFVFGGDHEWEIEWLDDDHHLQMLKSEEALHAIRTQIEELTEAQMPNVISRDGKMTIIHPDGDTEVMELPEVEAIEDLELYLADKLDEETLEELSETLQHLRIEEADLLREQADLLQFRSHGEFPHKLIIVRDMKVTISDMSKDDELSGKMGLDEKKGLAFETFSTYPNPNEGRFTVEFQAENTKNPVEIRILDITGREVYYDVWNNPASLYKNKVDLQSQGKGFYVLQIRQGEKTVNKKILIE